MFYYITRPTTPIDSCVSAWCQRPGLLSTAICVWPTILGKMFCIQYYYRTSAFYVAKAK